MAALTPIAVPSNRKQAFSSAWPRVGAARIATVMAAEEGASSSSQKLAARAITTAAQMRIPKAQALNGAPAKFNGRGMVAVVMGSLLAPEMAPPPRRRPRSRRTCE